MSKLFQDTETAFSLKTNFDLTKAYYLFRFMGNSRLVKIGTWLTNVSLKLHLPVQWMIRHTVFKQFCGGISEEDCRPVIEAMHKKGVDSVLDYSVEGKHDEASFDHTTQKTIEIIEFAQNNPAVPFAVFKPSGVGSFDIFQKVSENTPLSSQEKQKWERIKQRYHQICSKGYQCGVPILIDAEESWIQTAADLLSEEMMQQYNREKAFIFNTLQMYRHDRWTYLQYLYQKAENENFFVGLKIVRGAYMEKENKRAKENNYPSPICPSKEATDQNYNRATDFILKKHHRFSLFAGTHNEKSILQIINHMQQDQISHNCPEIWFAQLYGMSDHISFNLGKQGYNTAKYLPFGPIREVMPYLIRRAEENTSVQGQMGRELQLIWKEYKRRHQLKK